MFAVEPCFWPYNHTLLQLIRDITSDVNPCRKVEGDVEICLHNVQRSIDEFQIDPVRALPH